VVETIRLKYWWTLDLCDLPLIKAGGISSRVKTCTSCGKTSSGSLEFRNRHIISHYQTQEFLLLPVFSFFTRLPSHIATSSSALSDVETRFQVPVLQVLFKPMYIVSRREFGTRFFAFSPNASLDVLGLKKRRRSIVELMPSCFFEEPRGTKTI
jgi:hypothetical protein